MPEERYLALPPAEQDYWSGRELEWEEATSTRDNKIATFLRVGADFNRRVDEATAPAR